MEESQTKIQIGNNQPKQPHLHYEITVIYLR